MRSAPSIAFDYRPSPRVGAAATAIVALAVVAPWLAALPVAVRLVLSLLVGVSGAMALGRFRATRFRRIAYRRPGWTLVDADGTEHAAALIAHTTLAGSISLDFHVARRGRFRAWLDATNSDADTRRRLIVLLARAEVVQPG